MHEEVSKTTAVGNLAHAMPRLIGWCFSMNNVGFPLQCISKNISYGIG